MFDILVQRRRSTRAAKRFFRKLLTGLRMVPRAIVTDRLASYTAAKAAVLPSVAIFAAGAKTIGPGPHRRG